MQAQSYYATGIENRNNAIVRFMEQQAERERERFDIRGYRAAVEAAKLAGLITKETPAQRRAARLKEISPEKIAAAVAELERRPQPLRFGEVSAVACERGICARALHRAWRKKYPVTNDRIRRPSLRYEAVTKAVEWLLTQGKLARGAYEQAAKRFGCAPAAVRNRYVSEVLYRAANAA